MDMPEIIKSRRSVRTFDGTPLTAEHKARLEEFIGTISAPYDIPIEFVLLPQLGKSCWSIRLHRRAAVHGLCVVDNFPFCSTADSRISVFENS